MTPGRHTEGQLFGHPAGLFTLFFAEMWERFSYYGMRALLVFYMTKGFLGYGDERAYGVYGAYTALVYATPYLGGMLADQLLGARRAVIFGGLLMAAGHLLMTWESSLAFHAALALLICGNGFFKPNISSLVGSLYPVGQGSRDAGFTIFYMGINLGAAMAPLLCGYVGETYGWHYGFGLATIGMLAGVIIFVAPTRLTQIIVLGGAVTSAGAMVAMQLDGNRFLLGINVAVAMALIVAGMVACTALGRGGAMADLGAPPDPERLRHVVWGPLRLEHLVYAGTLAAVPVCMFLVQRASMAGWVLSGFGLLALGLIAREMTRATRFERRRMTVILVLMFFSMSFWAFFEQAGSSLNNFTDRNVDRVAEARQITPDEVGTTLRLRLTQEQVGHYNGERLVTLDGLSAARAAGQGEVDWQVVPENVGMGVGGDEVPASVFQATNPIFILLFGLLLSAVWTTLQRRGLEPATPVKFALALLQVGLGFAALWYGARHADARGMVGVGWLLLGYLLQTTGELCLSPVGLSMVTQLAPARLVSTLLGAWFLATAFSNYLAGMIAAWTGVVQADGNGTLVPPPWETVVVYGDVFGVIALTAIACAVTCYALSSWLGRWADSVE